MKKRSIWYVVGLTIGVLLAYGGYRYWHDFRGVGPAVKAPVAKIATLINTTGMPLHLPAGWKIEIFAEHLPGVRTIVFDHNNDAWVSQPSEGQVTWLQVGANHRVNHQIAVWQKLDRPHGLAFDPDDPGVLYVAEESKIERLLLGSEAGPQFVRSLPNGGEHVTRTIGFGPDKKLYVAIGSTCNACAESNPLRAAISVMNKDGSDLHTYATGLRNSVFFTWHNDQLWATDNGRDYLGDNLPPDDVNVIESGKFYGWPYCYGQKIQDKKVDGSAAAAAKCASSTGPAIEIPAHSAPLGLAFVPNDPAWPTDWQGNLLVAYHGSWNRSAPTGYKVVRYSFDAQGHPQPAQDFISGWLVSQGAIGRPVDLVFHDQALYVTDDKAGVIYRVTYQGEQPVSTACHPTGCSGQICADHDVVSDCVYLPEYQCYGTARCARSTDGTCAWVDSPELQACLDTYKKS